MQWQLLELLNKGLDRRATRLRKYAITVGSSQGAAKACGNAVNRRGIVGKACLVTEDACLRMREEALAEVGVSSHLLERCIEIQIMVLHQRGDAIAWVTD